MCVRNTLFRSLSLWDNRNEDICAKSIIETRCRIWRIRFSSFSLLFLTWISWLSRSNWHFLYSREFRRFWFGKRNRMNVDVSLCSYIHIRNNQMLISHLGQFWAIFQRKWRKFLIWGFIKKIYENFWRETHTCMTKYKLFGWFFGWQKSYLAPTGTKFKDFVSFSPKRKEQFCKFFSCYSN